MSIVDPPEPPEGGSSMRAKDLLNKPCIFRPVALGEWPAKAATEHEKAMKAQPYVECDVWVLDRAGIVEEGTAVRVGWWKAVEQLKGLMGQLVAARPQTEAGSNTVSLVSLTGEARAIAETTASVIGFVKPEIDGSEPEYPPGEEPF